MDFKFKNNFEFPIIIKSSTDSENVYVKLEKQA
ncbi:MAG: VanW family protein [Clostridiales bacterium]|nr:VanW family protein [Clostridiales bacterium]